MRVRQEQRYTREISKDDAERLETGTWNDVKVQRCTVTCK